MDRDEAIARIRKALKARSGKAWSVKGGRGTAWGWIDIDAPPARRTAEFIKKPDSNTHSMEDYEEVDTGKPNGHMSPNDRALLSSLLGLERVHHQGISIPAGHDFYNEYVARAEGRPVEKLGQQYWD
jgi:hypothetical protein